MCAASLRTRVLVLVALSVTACRTDASTAEPASPEVVEAKDKLPDASPSVDLDLSPSGIGAIIRGPEGAKATAKDDYVTVDAEPDFHMEVHRGELDMLEEKADIVRRWGATFREFVQSDETTVIYQTELAGKQRYHFVSTGEVEALHYYCRSIDPGVESLEAVKRMLVGCHAITAHDRVGGTATP